jgi:hypothetical protein
MVEQSGYELKIQDLVEAIECRHYSAARWIGPQVLPAGQHAPGNYEALATVEALIEAHEQDAAKRRGTLSKFPSG